MVRVIADYNPGSEDAGQGVLDLKAGGKSSRAMARSHAGEESGESRHTARRLCHSPVFLCPVAAPSTVLC